jgi:hypothetical protein
MHHRSLCVLMLFFCLVSPSLATVIGDFEGDMQGWHVPNNPNVSLMYNFTGATHNVVSIRLQANAGGWQDAMALDLVGNNALITAFLNSNVLTVDVTRLASEWLGNPENGYNQVFMVVDAGGQGWDVWDQQVAGNWTPDQGDQTKTLVFDTSSALLKIDANNLWWFEIHLVVHFDEGYTSGGLYYLDNIRLLPERPPQIIWVSQANDIDGDLLQDDLGWPKMLRDAGHSVDVTLDHWRELDLNKVNELNAADLVIVSRTSTSEHYATDRDEVLLWNTVTTPLIQTNASMLRSDRWAWIDTSNLNHVVAPPMRINSTDHEVFSGINLEGSQPIEVLDRTIGADPTQPNRATETSFISSTSSGNGFDLTSTVGGDLWMAEWSQGVEFYEGSGQVAGGQRMIFMAGTKEIIGVTPQGAMNLTTTGQQVFLNTVSYMLRFKAADPGSENLAHAYLFEDGTANDTVGFAHGVLAGNARIQNGALVTGQQGDCMTLPGHVLGLSTFDAVTLEAWYTPAAGANTGWSAMAFFGDSSRGTTDYLYMSSARANDSSRAAISVGNAVSPLDAESGVDGPKYDDDVLHHMVATLSESHIALYIDGQLQGMTRLREGNSLSRVSSNLAYLAKSGFRGDAQWIGQIHEFNIYDRALEPGEVSFLAAGGVQE